MMSVNDEHDIEGLKCIGAAVAAARDAMGTHVVPGVTTKGRISTNSASTAHSKA
jgi:hypothetical protein